MRVKNYVTKLKVLVVMCNGGIILVANIYDFDLEIGVAQHWRGSKKNSINNDNFQQSMLLGNFFSLHN